MTVEQIIDSLLGRLGEILVERKKNKLNQDQESSGVIETKDNPAEEKKDSPLKEEKGERVRYVVLKPKVEDKVILQQLEAIQKDREGIKSQKEDMVKEKVHIQSQQSQLRSAMDEAKRNKVI
jgi:hypothetical protein